jgi:hypothetical protein
MAIKDFKYAQEINLFDSCPPKEYEEHKQAAFRWVHEDLSNDNNFKPLAYQNPQLVNKWISDELRCKAHGLSFFNTFEGAKEKFMQETIKRPNFPKRIGNSIATVQLDKHDGVCSKPETLNFGHFTFHEYICIDLVENIESVMKILKTHTDGSLEWL